MSKYICLNCTTSDSVRMKLELEFDPNTVIVFGDLVAGHYITKQMYCKKCKELDRTYNKIGKLKPISELSSNDRFVFKNALYKGINHFIKVDDKQHKLWYKPETSVQQLHLYFPGDEVYVLSQ